MPINLLSLIAGITIGVVICAICFIFWRHSWIRKYQAEDRYPVEVSRVLSGLETPAALLNSSLSPIYANAPARDDHDLLSATVFSNPHHLAAFKQVLVTGAPYVRMPEPETEDTVRVRAFKVSTYYLAVIIDDIGEAQRVNQMRRDFIANVSHELKTPVAAIGLLSEALVAGADDQETVRAFAKSLGAENERLANLVRDIIDLSQAQSSLQPEDREPVDLRELVRAEVAAHESLAEPRGIALMLVEPAQKHRPAIMYGRKNELGTALSNLLSNAIRYSPEFSTVRVMMRFRAHNLEVAVADTGPGIAPEYHERIFERFYRVDSARTRSTGGTGLGLSIVRHTMRSHGGEVSVASNLGKGSVFTLVFPLHEKSEEPEAKKDAEFSKKDRKIIQKRTRKDSREASRLRALAQEARDKQFLEQ